MGELRQKALCYTYVWWLRSMELKLPIVTSNTTTNARKQGPLTIGKIFTSENITPQGQYVSLFTLQYFPELGSRSP